MCCSDNSWGLLLVRSWPVIFSTADGTKVAIFDNLALVFNAKLLIGLKADNKKCNEYIEGSLAMCTALAPVIGYDEATKIAYEAYNSGKTIRQVLKDKKILSDKEISKILDPKSMIKPK